MSGARHIIRHRAPRGTAAHLHDKLHVVTALINTRRYGARYRLYNDFADHMKAQGAILWTVECAFGRRAFACTDADNPHHIQVRTDSECWHKEALQNVGVTRLPDDWKYVLFADSDINWTRIDLVNEVCQTLQHHRIVQPWTECIDLGPDYQVIGRHESFAYSLAAGRPRRRFDKDSYYYGPPGRHGVNWWHPGYAVAFRRDVFNELGRLIDWAILGSADNHMMWCIAEECQRSVHPKASRGYKRLLYDWQEKCKRYVRRDLGYVGATITHGWHGRKAARAYSSRWRILVDNGFDPEVHLKRDWQGLHQLIDRRDEASLGLRDEMRRYFARRNEDGLDL